MTNDMTTINLYNEPHGISVLIDRFGDITNETDRDTTRVIGHALYACSLDQAHRKIQEAYWASDARFAHLTR